jgi:dTDP-4-dehydrorhamnose reductase
MRVLVTGGGGFVGSNVVAVATERGDDVAVLVRQLPVRPEPGCRYSVLDLLDTAAVSGAVEDARPDVVVHTAIWNDFAGIYAERRLAWEAYVGVTRTLADAANAVGAALLTVSTDWVFDGTQGPADERTPPNPVNYYGVLKAASELVTFERAQDPIVVRIAGVQGVHRAGQPQRGQDAGFGHLAGAVVAALSAGEEFTVWESAAINSLATPSLASVAAEWMLALAERGSRGTFHCCGADGVTRMELAARAAAAFDLDPALLRSGPPDPGVVRFGRLPFDTRLDARVTARELVRDVPSLDELLARLRAECSRGYAPSGQPDLKVSRSHGPCAEARCPDRSGLLRAAPGRPARRR